MAKVAYSKLKLKTNEEVKQVKLNNDITIEVKQYLPIQDKLALIGRVAEYAHMEDANYSNPVKAAVFRDVVVVENYTNITFTDKKKEDLAKLYEQLYSNGIIDLVIEHIPDTEYKTIVKGVEDTIVSIYAYMNSVVGILDTIKTDYSNLQIDLNAIQDTLLSPDGLAVLKEIAPMLSGLEN